MKNKVLLSFICLLIMLPGVSLAQSITPTIVYFNDINLESAVREALNKPNGDITQEDMLHLTTLNIGNPNEKNRIKDLSGLQYAINLHSLNLHNNNISDILPLAKLTNLTDLNLGGNQITDISLLKNHTNLIKLTLNSNEIKDISYLNELTKLTELYLGGNQIYDISPLENLTNLKVLFLDGNKINDVSPLEKLNKLNILTLALNQISDISKLSNLANLTQLTLGWNNITDISKLNNLINLIALNIDYHVVDTSVVQNFPNMQYLVFSGPYYSNIKVENNPIGTPDTVEVSNLKPGNVGNKIKVSDAAGNVLGVSSVIEEEQTSAVVEVSQLGTNSGTVFVSFISSTREESPRTPKAYSDESTIIDTMPPLTRVSLVSPSNEMNGWYASNVTINLDAIDDMSGVAKTEFRINGGNWTTYTESFDVTFEGKNIVEYRSIDNEGNIEEIKSVEVKIDKTNPTLKFSIEPSVIVNKNHRLVPVKTLVKLDDNFSGVASLELVSILSNEPDNDKGDGNTIQDIQGAEFGTYDTEFLLRAERSGKGDRIYTVTYKVTDNAGNSIDSSQNIVVKHDNSKK